MSASPTPDGVSRRDRLRAEVTDQIIDIGRRQLEHGGVSNVNWRAIAAEIGMNPASLYTYVDGINDLYTRILGRSFRSLADAIREAERSAGSDARARFLACATAYRAWALDHPREFNLIFTDQIPGYAAPSTGDTADAETAVNMPFVRALQDVLGESETQHPSSLSGRLATLGYELRSLMHGFTILEINHHAPYVNGTPDRMIAALNRCLDSFLEANGAPSAPTIAPHRNRRSRTSAPSR